jgi:predicted transcriptional regulator
MPDKSKTKTRYVDVNASSDSFVSKFMGSSKDHDFSDIKLLRSLLSNEKARILYVLKHKKPKSMYALAKLLDRDFKSVRGDLLVLERFGFVSFFHEKKGNRSSLMPVLAADRIQIIVSV